MSLKDRAIWQPGMIELLPQIKKYSADEDRDSSGKWTSGGDSSSVHDMVSSESMGNASVPRGSDLRFETQPFVGDNVQGQWSMWDSNSGMLQQTVDGNLFTFQMVNKKKSLILARYTNGDAYTYIKDHFTLTNAQFPEGVTYKDNGMTPPFDPNARLTDELYGPQGSKNHKAAITKGEGPGHPFRGNRYTGGFGETSTEIGSRGWIKPDGTFVSVGKTANHGEITKTDPKLSKAIRSQKGYSTTYHHENVVDYLMEKGWVRVVGPASNLHEYHHGFELSPKTPKGVIDKINDHILTHPDIGFDIDYNKGISGHVRSFIVNANTPEIQEGHLDELLQRQSSLDKRSPIGKAIEAVRSLPHEHATVFNAEGKRVWDKDGGHDFVALKELEHKDLEGATFIHNHPSGVAPSVDDIGSACALQLGRIYAVGKNGFTYSVSPPPGKNMFEPEMWKKIRNTGQAADGAVREAFSKAIASGDISVDDANRDHWHMVNTIIAFRTGLQYKRTGKGEYHLKEIMAAHKGHIPVYDAHGVSKDYPPPEELSKEADITFSLLHQKQEAQPKVTPTTTNADSDTRR